MPAFQTGEGGQGREERRREGREERRGRKEGREGGERKGKEERREGRKPNNREERKKEGKDNIAVLLFFPCSILMPSARKYFHEPEPQRIHTGNWVNIVFSTQSWQHGHFKLYTIISTSVSMATYTCTNVLFLLFTFCVHVSSDDNQKKR